MLLLQAYAVNSVLALLKALATMMSSDAEMIKRYPEINDKGRGEEHFASCLIAFGYAPKGAKWFDQFFIAVRRKELSIRAKLCDEVARACISYIDTYVGNGGSVYFVTVGEIALKT